MNDLDPTVVLHFVGHASPMGDHWQVMVVEHYGDHTEVVVAARDTGYDTGLAGEAWSGLISDGWRITSPSRFGTGVMYVDVEPGEALASAHFDAAFRVFVRRCLARGMPDDQIIDCWNAGDRDPRACADDWRYTQLLRQQTTLPRRSKESSDFL